LLSALHPLPAAMTLTFFALFVAVVTALLASLVMCIPMELLVLNHVTCLSDLHVHVLGFGLLRGESLVDLGDLLRLE